ncbi:MAG: hypothetical protein DHS20C03_31900 [Minwuia thermotolerans]|nr:MAG: hypothetical protein DHS20C03_31900 [Minwuia thermotolerans]
MYQSEQQSHPMSDPSNNEKKPLDPPARDPKRRIGRAVVEAAAQATPLTAGVARLYQATHPSAEDVSRENWEDHVTDRVNAHDDRLNAHDQVLQGETVAIEGVAAKLLAALARDCPNGWRERLYELGDACALVPDTPRQEVEDAIHELADYGLVDIDRVIGAWRFRVSAGFYEIVDEHVMGWRTEQDAAELARQMLEDDALSHMPAMEEALGWPLRRLNPAISFLMRFVPEGRTRKVMPSPYPTMGFLLLGEDRARLRRFMRGVPTGSP